MSILYFTANEEPVMEMNTGENYDTRVYGWIEKVEDILNEYNPLKYRDDDEDDEDAEQHEAEEQRLSNVLEKLQKKEMKKLEQDMNADDERAMEVDEETSDEEEENGENEEATQRARASNEREKKDMDSKLKQLWKNYEQKISAVKPQDLNKVCIWTNQLWSILHALINWRFVFRYLPKRSSKRWRYLLRI